jgi:hypothetical protein
VSGDGCCPPGCNAQNDKDCSASCGNGIDEPGETCDGNCPKSCDDGIACTLDVMTGSAANSSATSPRTTDTACVDGDGCCPAGCNALTDKDCSASCGNGIVEPGETCDGNCPTSCDDHDACTFDALTGSAANCSAACSHSPITACVSGDGCCPAGCNANDDKDCAPTCGNGIVEPGESCDGNCPTSCDDGDACTTDSLTGDAAHCTAVCTHTPTTSCGPADGCCPLGCSSDADPDCLPLPRTGLLGEWLFAGGTKDTSGNGNDATAKGGATLAADRHGNASSAYHLDGTSGYLRVADAAVLRLTGEYTLSAWVRPEAFGFLDGIVSKYQVVGSNGYTLRMGYQAPYANLDLDESTSPANLLQLDAWQHVVGVIRAGRAEIWLNGKLVSTGAPGYLTKASADEVRFGSDYSGRYLKGSIDDVRLYGRALSQAEIAALFAE